METTDLEKLEITVDPKDLDENKFVTIWNVAASTVGGGPIPDAKSRQQAVGISLQAPLRISGG